MILNNFNLIIGFLLLILTTTFINGDYTSCDYLEQSLMFYKANRAGRLPDNDIPWRGNSVLKDASSSNALDSNGDGDLSKGYFDAGDGVKFLFPMSFSMTVLALGFLESKSNIDSCGLTQLYLETIKWGTDFIIACHTSENEFVGQVGDGNLDHGFWGPPEMINMARPVYKLTTSAGGTDLAMEAASALAAASIIWKNIDPSYSLSCLTHATQLYNFGISYKAKYSDSISNAASFYSSYRYEDEIVWGSIWLYKATETASYLSTAEKYYSDTGMFDWGNPPLSWDNKAPGCSLLLYKINGKDLYKTGVERNLNQWLKGGSIDYTPGGLAWYQQWGPCRYAASAAFVAALYNADTKYTDFAKSQLDYIIGNNPKKQSFVVGMGPNHPVNPHHRAAHGSTNDNINDPVNNKHILTGALVGGPGSDDSYTDDRTNYITNEVATDYNAGFVGLLAVFAKGTVTPTQSPSTPSPTQSQTPTITPTQSQTPNITPTQSQTPSDTPTPTQSPSITPAESSEEKPTPPGNNSNTSVPIGNETTTPDPTTPTTTPATTSPATTSPTNTPTITPDLPADGTTTDGSMTTNDLLSKFIVLTFIMLSTFILLN